MASRGDINVNLIQPPLCERWLQIDVDETLEKTGKYTKLKSKDYFDAGNYPVIDQGDKFISGFINDESLLYQGDLPIIIFGDHTRNIKYVDFNFAAEADGTKILRPNECFDPKFYFYYFKSLSIPDLGYSRHYALLKLIKFPLPPLAEQQRIVAKLDALFGQLDTIKKSLDNVPVLLKNFRQQVLTQAVTGKLTEEWRKGKELESIEIQLKKTLAIRDELIKTKKLKKVKDYGEILKDEQDLNIPFLWRWLRWVDLLSLNEYSMKRGPFGSALKKDDFVESGIRVFEQYNPINDDPYWARYYISEQRYKELKSFTADSGDLLISCSGVTLGRITEIPADTEKVIINQALLKLSLNEDIILNSYFIKLFRSKYIQEKIFDNAQGSAIPNMVGVDVLKKMALPIPPIEEQKEIVGRVENLFAKADAIEEQYTTLKEKIDKMPQAILHKAFKGELTQQLYTDGDARELLLQIKELKCDSSRKGKQKKNDVL